MADPLARRCKDCGEDKPATLEYFYRTSHQRKDGSYTLMGHCKQCNALRSRLYYQENKEVQRVKLREKAREARKQNPEAYWARQILRKYNLTVVDFNILWDNQDGCCAVCGEPEPPEPSRLERLHIDHDHVTGKVRGLLCTRCNWGLGHFTDDPELLRRAAEYLEGGDA